MKPIPAIGDSRIYFYVSGTGILFQRYRAVKLLTEAGLWFVPIAKETSNLLLEMGVRSILQQ